MEIDEFYSQINKRFGNIKRARGPFLYTQKNVRLIDLYREDGRAVLGWDFDARRVFKNSLSKSLTGSFITSHRAQLEKAASFLLNSGRKIFCFSKKTEARSFALSISPDGVCAYKSFFSGIDYSKIECVILEPPLPWTDNFFILAVLKNALNEKKDFFKNAGEFFPGALEAAASRAIYDLISAQKRLEEKDFFIYDAALLRHFTRTGPRLKSKVPLEDYDAFVLHCMDLGILINPDFNRDSFVPFGADPGVLDKLKAFPFKGGHDGK